MSKNNLRIRRADKFVLTSAMMEKGSREPSVAVPDQAPSISSLLRRFQQGLDLKSAGRVVTDGIHDEDDFDAPDLEKVRDGELVELDELRRETAAKIAEMNRGVRAASADRKKRKALEVAKVSEGSTEGKEPAKEGRAESRTSEGSKSKE